MILAIVGLCLGIVLGFLFPWSIPVAYSKLFSIALLASLDSVFGGIRAASKRSCERPFFARGAHFFVQKSEL